MVEKEYAKAVYELALEENKEQVFDDCFRIVKNALETEDFRKLLSSPAINKEEKKKIIKNVFGSLDETFLDFLYVVSDHNRMNMLPAVYEEYDNMRMEEQHVKKVEVISAKALTPAQIKKIEESIAAKFSNKKIEINNTVKPDLIGGIQIQTDGESIDVSLKSTLERLKVSL